MLTLENAIIYDIETFPNCFTLYAESLFNDSSWFFEISDFKDDRQKLIEWLSWFARTGTPMIGFNNVHFDYRVIHHIFYNPHTTVAEIYSVAMSIINSQDRFGGMIWASDRFAPQIDLFQIHHFHNKAKSTSLKALEINMRSASVVDMPVEVGTTLTAEQINEHLIPYNIHDVKETKRFAKHSMDAINFRISLIDQFGVDVMNWPDTKIGSRMMEDKIGNEVCYDYTEGKRKMRQTPRMRVDLNEIIFPYIKFDNPEFNRVLDYLRQQVLKAEEINQFDDKLPTVQTKGVFKGLTACVGGIDFHFGTGGIHGSVEKQRVIATDEWLIRDIDVASLYPSIAIVNNLAPEHLGEHFSRVYAELPKERKKWQNEKGKKCVEANTLKLASNGVYGNSNNAYSVFYDPKFTLTITVNGQLMLCMLAEKLVSVPTLKIIQINTDGVTYYIHRDHEPQAAEICKEWEQTTRLVLEDADYSRMFIRDVNNYIAEGTDGSLKLKGAYWTPSDDGYHASIGNAQPPAWHKDLGNLVSVRAAVAAMVYGVDPTHFIRVTDNPYDFMCRIKTRRADELFWGNDRIQKTSRYYIAKQGRELIKTSPPAKDYVEGHYKKANGISEPEYFRVMSETGGQWDERVCTKNKSKYVTRRTAVQAGHKVALCNNVEDFDFSNVDYDWYINEARKLII